MKYKFSFIQVTNWLMICRQNLLKIREETEDEFKNKDEIIKKLKKQKSDLLLVKDILNRRVRLHGISPDFLKNLQAIKKEYGIQEDK
jgi:hypothetical protein